jgi:hypothetical protein
MRRTMLIAVLLMVGTALGAALHEPIAAAAEKLTPVFVTNDNSAPVPVRQQGTSDVHVTNSTLPVQQQGTADVHVTNGSLSVDTTPEPAITSGGYGIGTNAGGSVGVVPKTATAISLSMSSGVSYAKIQYQGQDVAFFYGPAFGGESSVVLALSRPIKIDNLECGGTSGTCRLGWVGATP